MLMLFEKLYDIFFTLKAYFLLTLLIIVVIFGLLLMLIILPIYYINKKCYRILTNKILNFIVPASLAPISWQKFNVYINTDYKKIKNLDTQCIYMCNHAGRIDWLLSLWFGYVGCPKKVNFISEITTKFLPGIGWFRNLCEDIYVSKSFNKDQDIITTNLNSYKENNIIRDIFFSPEGVIADNNEHDINMINDCNEFCKKNNIKPFKYVLTPRYKGLNCLINKNDKYYTFTIAYVKNNKLMNTKLTNKDREIPDLISLLKYDIDVYLYCKKFKCKNITDPEKLKKKLLKRYAMHDKYLAHFEKNINNKKEFYQNQNIKEPFQKIPSEYLYKSNNFFVSCAILYYIGYKYNKNKLLNKLYFYLFCSVSASHLLGEYFSGYSRESVPFETITKSILYYSRDKNKIK